jgi:hypothetical protein
MKKVLVAYVSRTGNQRKWRCLLLKESAPMLFDTMLYVFKMDMVDLGPLNLREAVVGSQEGAKACQEYGKAIGAKLRSVR